MLVQRSLRYAVVTALTVGLALPTSVALVLDWSNSRREAMADLRAELDRTSEVMAYSLAEPIWLYAPELAAPLIKAQVKDPRFIAVRIVEEAQNQLFFEFKRPDPNPQWTLTRTRVVQRDGRDIAKLEVMMSAEPHLQRKRDELLASVWRSLATLTVSLVLILFVLRRRILQPMEQLSRTAAKLADGDLIHPLTPSGDDEIAHVGQAMEHMRRALLKAFDELRSHAQMLEHQVGARTQQLTDTNQELSQTLDRLRLAQRELVESEKLASLGRLVAGVAHELNTPLGNAMTVVTALDDRWRDLDRMLRDNIPMRRSMLDELVRDTRRGQDILLRNVQKAANLVRDFKQVAIDQTNDVRRDFDLAHVIEDVLVMVEPSFKHSPYRIDTELEPGLAMNSFPGALGQVLTNLLMNCLLHAFDGRDHGVVNLRCARTGADWVHLKVSDDGCGMDPGVVKHIFDPFFTTKLGKGGSGLGLHIVHNIVCNVLGGQIEVASEPGRGTTMLLLLPCHAPERAVNAASEALAG
ncbi:ATP-binding protein [Roseateles sp. BYS180W]|uniref:histidine kinase n=1 Tax=Roseateles rivi TaxID=3299028 RepID=A0ABW7FZM0_9BURK